MEGGEDDFAVAGVLQHHIQDAVNVGVEVKVVVLLTLPRLVKQ